MRASSALVRVSRLDRLGMGLSTLCAIHCIATPFVLGLLPLIGLSFVANSTFEWVMVSIIGVVATLTYFAGYRLHGRLGAFPFLGIGLLVFLVIRPLVLGYDHSHAGHGHSHGHSHGHDSFLVWEVALTALGGAAFIVGHWLNAKWSKPCEDCDAE